MQRNGRACGPRTFSQERGNQGQTGRSSMLGREEGLVTKYVCGVTERKELQILDVKD